MNLVEITAGLHDRPPWQSKENCAIYSRSAIIGHWKVNKHMGLTEKIVRRFCETEDDTLGHRTLLSINVSTLIEN